VTSLVGQVALGGAAFSLVPDFPQASAVAVIRAAADAGVRVFDAARAYAPVGEPLHNERLFATALAGRDDVLIGTKGGHFRTGPREWDVDNSPARLRRDVDDSLRALGVDRLGLFYLHRADGRERFRGGTGDPPPVGAAVAALDELRRAGKLAGIGLSNVTVRQLKEAVALAPVVAVQNNLIVGTADDAVLRRCEDLGIPFFAYAPLRGAALGDGVATRFPATAALAARRGVSVQRLLLRGLLASSPVLSVVVGAGRVETAVDSAAAMAEPWDDEARTAYEDDR
jgi:aryl-alcohol dehydrogenase-like predicted oxidoreductase